MKPPLLEVINLEKSFGGVKATDGLNLTVKHGEIHAVIGPNGAGKSTLINQLSGELRSDSGRILFEGREIGASSVQARARQGLARSYQITSVFPEFTALQNVMLAVQGASGRNLSFWRAAIDDKRLVEPAQALLAQAGLAGQARTRVAAMAHGARRQLELAMTLALQPRLMLLDEPMAGMSAAESMAMVELLQRLRGTIGILLVEHDMDAVFALADRITVLVYGRDIACAGVDEIRADPAVRAAYLGDATEVI